MQARLTAARLRQEAREEKGRSDEGNDEVTWRKRSREEANPRMSEEKKEEARPKFNAPPPAEARVDLQDEWTLRGNNVTCLLRRPRRELFCPTGGGCPVSWQKLKGKRTTQVIMNANGEIREYVDDWTQDDAGGPSGDPHNPFNGEWTGWAEFEIEDEPN